ncbi:hypothetical protein O6P43_025523 [Quillaja saponaria]|uniref:Uncharacterized protein n=1 Tax=Quillaja saponaria TaxID=32244 RepID=A0AAD7LA17_QUISA|nr:hypothetical protein O6P43_025523 [Quillaja saponaria]
MNIFAKRLFGTRSRGGIDELGIGKISGISTSPSNEAEPEPALVLEARTLGKNEKKESILTDDVKKAVGNPHWKMKPGAIANK